MNIKNFFNVSLHDSIAWPYIDPLTSKKIRSSKTKLGLFLLFVLGNFFNEVICWLENSTILLCIRTWYVQNSLQVKNIVISVGVMRSDKLTNTSCLRTPIYPNKITKLHKEYRSSRRWIAEWLDNQIRTIKKTRHWNKTEHY